MSAGNLEQTRKALNRQLAHLVAHEIRVKAFTVLVERTASPKEVAQLLGERLGTVGHHIRELAKLELVELVDERRVRGAVEHFYRAVRRPILDLEDWEELSIPDREKMSIWTLHMILADAARSLHEGVFDVKPSRHLSRVPMVVDEQGWDEVIDIHERALREILEVQANSAERMAESGEQGTHMVAAMTSFEMPGPSEWLKPRKLD